MMVSGRVQTADNDEAKARSSKDLRQLLDSGRQYVAGRVGSGTTRRHTADTFVATCNHNASPERSAAQRRARGPRNIRTGDDIR